MAPITPVTGTGTDPKTPHVALLAFSCGCPPPSQLHRNALLLLVRPNCVVIFAGNFRRQIVKENIFPRIKELAEALNEVFESMSQRLDVFGRRCSMPQLVILISSGRVFLRHSILVYIKAR